MALVAIWVDQKEAKIFNYTTKGIQKKDFKSHHNDHHLHRPDQMDHQRLENDLFKQFTGTLTDAEQILIMGPGQAKQHLKSYIEKHNQALGKKIVGCENMDHPTEAQITAFASKYFNTEHLHS